jgi:epoxyqueuosine reductase
MKRAKLRGLKRNAAVVLGNIGSEADVLVLKNAMTDAEPLCANTPHGLSRK